VAKDSLDHHRMWPVRRLAGGLEQQSMNTTTRSWLDPRVDVRASGIDGNGLFARELIEQGAVVAMLRGRFMTDAEFEALTSEKYSAAAVGENLHVLLDADDPVTFGNHSCDPNLWMGDAITVTARRDIQPGEELTIDYALHTVSPAWSMPCQCGSPLCRRRVTGNDWQLPTLQVRYKGHFSPFIDARIARLKRP
jgi:uncharacterized protein